MKTKWLSLSLMMVAIPAMAQQSEYQVLKQQKNDAELISTLNSPGALDQLNQQRVEQAGTWQRDLLEKQYHMAISNEDNNHQKVLAYLANREGTVSKKASPDIEYLKYYENQMQTAAAKSNPDYMKKLQDKYNDYNEKLNSSKVVLIDVSTLRAREDRLYQSNLNLIRTSYEQQMANIYSNQGLVFGPECFNNGRR